MYKQLLYLLIFTLTLFSKNLFGQEAQFPLEEVAVSDNINVLDSTQKASLSKKCKDFYRDKKVQIEIALIPVAWRGDLSIEEYSLQLAEKRKLGNKELDSGILILIVGSPEDTEGRGVRIEVGYGLEDKLTDSKAKRIIDYSIIPSLKLGKYDLACQLSIQKIKEILKDFDSSTESTTATDIEEKKAIEDDEEVVEEEKEDSKIFYTMLIIMIISFVIYIIGMSGSVPNSFATLPVYPFCMSLGYLMFSVDVIFDIQTLLFCLVNTILFSLMLYAVKSRHPEEKDLVVELAATNIMIAFILNIVLLMLSYIWGFPSVFGISILGCICLVPSSFLMHWLGLSGALSVLNFNFNLNSDKTYYSGESGYSGGGSSSSGGGYSSGGSSSSGGGYSGGGSSSSGGGGGGYSGGGGSFGGGGASGDW